MKIARLYIISIISFLILIFGRYPIQSFFDQFREYSHVSISSVALAENGLRIILEKEKYGYKKSISAAIISEIPPMKFLDKHYFEFFLGQNSTAIELKKVVSFKNYFDDLTVFAVPYSDMFFYHDYVGDTIECYIFKPGKNKNQLIEKISTVDKFFGIISPNNETIYYFSDNALFRFNITGNEKEMFPRAAYDFFKKSWSKRLGVTSVKNLVYRLEADGSYYLHDLYFNKDVDRFKIPDYYRVLDVVYSKDDRALILTESGNEFCLFNSNGNNLKCLDLRSKLPNMISWAWDKVNNEIYFVTFNNNQDEISTGVIELLVWNYPSDNLSEKKMKLKW